MVINRLDITSFGGIKNKTLLFSDGFNILQGPNEAGKSTILSFIRFMLYGVVGRKSEIKNYEPLSGDAMCGQMELTYKDEKYIIIRNTALSKAKQIEVINKNTGEQFDKEFAKEPGQNILGVNEHTFLNTLFVSQSSSKISPGSGEIHSRLSNLKETGDEEVSYQKLLKTIDDIISSLSSTRKKNALIPNAEKELSILNSDLAKAKEIETRKDDLKKQISELQSQQTILKEAKDKLIKDREKSIITDFKINYDNKNKQLLKIKETLNSLTDEYSKLDLKLIEKFDNLNETLETEFLSDYEKPLIDTDLLEKNAKINLLKKAFFSSCVFSAVFLVLFFVFVLIKPFFWAWLSIFLCAWFFAGILTISKKTKKLENDILELSIKKEEIIQKKANFLKRFGALDKSNFISLKNESARQRELKSVLNSKIESAKREFEKLNDEVSALNEIAKEKYSNIDFENFDISNIIDIKEIDKQINAFSEKEVNIKIRINEIEFELKNLKNSSLNPFIISENISEKKDELLTLKKELAVALSAKEILESSFNEMKNNFAPRLAKKSAEIFNVVTQGKYEDMLVNEHFDAKVLTDNKFIDSAFLSVGTLEQLYFSIRLGIISNITEKMFPLILDDAFSQYDNRRLKDVLDFLKEYSKNAQVILATCHTREIEALKEYDGANVITI